MYNYETEKPKLFDESNQKLFLEIRDRVHSLLKQCGAARMKEIMRGSVGDSWLMLACVDRLVELGEIKELKQENCPGQYRVFIAAYNG